jgi:hypothetical protein
MDVLFRAPFFATFGARLGDVLVISPLWVLVRVSPFHAKPSALDDFNHGVLFSPLGSYNFWRFLSCTHGVLVLDAPGLATRWQSHQIKPVGRQMHNHGHMSSRPVPGPCMHDRVLCSWLPSSANGRSLGEVAAFAMCFCLPLFTSVLAFWQFCVPLSRCAQTSDD